MNKKILIASIILFIFTIMLASIHKIAFKKGVLKSEVNYNNISDKDFILGIATISPNPNIGHIFVPFPVGSKYEGINFERNYKNLYDFYGTKESFFLDYSFTLSHYASSKYFSLEAVFDTNESSPRGYRIHTCVTVDLELNKEIFLTDLIHVNDEFINMVKYKNITQSFTDESIRKEFWDPSDFSNYTTEEIKNMFDLCSIPTTSENYLKKPSFYLEPNMICFINFDESNEVFYIKLEDIEKLLKVNKW